MTRYKKAEQILVSVCRHLELMNCKNTIPIIEDLYPYLIPYLVKGEAKNPVHHTASVMDLLASILMGEGRTGTFDVQVSLLAALFHDAALGLSSVPKITERHIRDKAQDLLAGRCTLEELAAYLEVAVEARKEHMRGGKVIAERMLAEYNDRQSNGRRLKESVIREATRIVAHHDDPKIPVITFVLQDELESAQGYDTWLSSLDRHQRAQLVRLFGEPMDSYLIGVDDWLLQYHHEADLLWMVTSEGIAADLRRFDPADAKTPREILENNVALHQNEVNLYRHLGNFLDYGFIENTVYRSRTGYSLFDELKRDLEKTL